MTAKYCVDQDRSVSRVRPRQTAGVALSASAQLFHVWMRVEQGGRRALQKSERPRCAFGFCPIWAAGLATEWRVRFQARASQHVQICEDARRVVILFVYSSFVNLCRIVESCVVSLYMFVYIV